MKVIGIGEQKTPKPFISACDRFIFIEVLDGSIKKKAAKAVSGTKKPVEKTTTKTPEKPAQKPLNKIDEPTLELIESTIEDLADELKVDIDKADLKRKSKAKLSALPEIDLHLEQYHLVNKNLIHPLKVVIQKSSAVQRNERTGKIKRIIDLK